MSDTEDIIKHLSKELKLDLEENPLLLTKGSNPDLALKRISLEIPALDVILGGGFPRGRLSLLLGDWSSGKTFIAQQAIASVQRKKGLVAFIDSEKTYAPDWFEKSGVDIENLLVSQFSGGEVSFDILHSLVKANFDLVVLDSIASLIPLSEEEDDMVDIARGISKHPILVNRGIRKLIALNKSTAVIAINQYRETIGGYGDSRVPPGGRAQRFHASIILEVRRGAWIDEPGMIGGKKAKVKKGFNLICYTVKNKTAPPFQYAEIPFLFTGVIDTVSGLIGLGIDFGIISQTGPYFKYKDHKVLGKANLIDFLNDNPLEIEEIRHKIESSADTKGGDYV